MPPRKRTPSSDSASTLETVTRLMTERQKYDQWLRELEAKKDSTPPKVYDRVRADYSERLEEVSNALREHTSSMQEHARNLMVRLKELEVSEEELVEEQSENELRAQVGELSAGEWESSKKKAQRMLVKFKEDQELIADDLNKIRDLLSGAASDERSRDAAEAPRRSTDFDELEFLKSVVGPTTPPSSTPPSAPKPKPAEPEATKVAAKAEPAPAPPVQPSPPPAKPAAPVPRAATPMSMNKLPDTVDGPTVIRSSGAVEQPKTLKCQECGAMNYPSEWYCERCGAELTVI
jgi:hypothetical protein